MATATGTGLGAGAGGIEPPPPPPAPGAPGSGARVVSGGWLNRLRGELVRVDESALVETGPEPETLSDVSDSDVDIMVLDEEERQAKSEIWHEVHKEYLEHWAMREKERKKKREQKALRAEKAAEWEAGAAGGGAAAGAHRPYQRQKPPAPAETAAKGTLEALEQKPGGKDLTADIDLEDLFT